MHRRIHVLALVAAFGLAACSPDNTVAPLKAPTAPKFDRSSGRNPGNYLVVMTGTSVPQGFAQAVARLGGKVTSSHSGAGFATVSGLTDASAASLAATTGVSEVKPDQLVALDKPPQGIQSAATALSSPPVAQSQDNPASAILGSYQWNMELIGADTAWALGKLGSPDVTVAILDTGMDYDNRDFAGLVDLSRSTSFMNVFFPESTEVRRSDDEITTAVFPTRNKISDYNGHGTNVASQVSSKAFAFAGVTSKTTLIGVKVLGSNGVGSFGGILNGILWAADHGADVANMSLGGSFSRQGNGELVHEIKKVFDYAARKGMLIVVSAGNDGVNLDRNGNTFAGFCDAPHVICVAAVGPDTVGDNPDRQAFYTNFGKNSIDVAAPGGNLDTLNLPESDWPWGPDIASWVWSFCSRTLLVFTDAGGISSAPCLDGGHIFRAIGTSQASPHVTGLAALLVAGNGHARPDRIKTKIEDTGDPIPRRLGESRISVSNALGITHPRRHDGRDDDDHDGYGGFGGPGRH